MNIIPFYTLSVELQNNPNPTYPYRAYIRSDRFRSKKLFPDADPGIYKRIYKSERVGMGQDDIRNPGVDTQKLRQSLHICITIGVSTVGTVSSIPIRLRPHLAGLTPFRVLHRVVFFK